MQIGDVQLLTDVSTFRVGGPNNSPGLFEFDLSPYLQYANQTSLLEKVQLQLDYQNATIVNGQKLSVFIGNTESDGVVRAANDASVLRLSRVNACSRRVIRRRAFSDRHYRRGPPRTGGGQELRHHAEVGRIEPAGFRSATFTARVRPATRPAWR